MSRLIFKLNTNNSVEIMDSDFIEQTISVQVDGDIKIIEVDAVEHVEPATVTYPDIMTEEDI
jgi:hypothetical protein